MGDISKDIQSKFPSEQVKALINIKYTANWLNRQESDFLNPYHISPQQYNILRILKGAKNQLKARDVKEKMVERSPNATRLMDKLCEKKLIERIRCDRDRRVVYIKINQSGLELLKTIDKSRNSSFLKNITGDEAKKLNTLLDKIR